VQLFTLSYNYSWILIRDWSLGGSMFFNNGSESPGPNSQDFNQAGTSLSLGYQLTKNWVANVYYSFIGRESTVQVDQYNQQIIGVNLNYTF
jgi:outer membrane protein assembly factor BamA